MEGFNDTRLEQLLDEEVEETTEETVSESNPEPAEPEADSTTEESTGEEPSDDDIPYTPDEIKRLGLDRLDPKKLPPDLVPFYRSMQADYTRKMQQIARQRDSELREQAQPNPSAQPPDPKQFVAALSEAAKARACSMMGVPVDKFDEFDPQHQTAFSVANYEIQQKLQSMQQERLGQDRAKQTFESIVQDFASQEPNYDRINSWATEWAEALPVTKYNQVISDIQSGDPSRVKAVVEEVRKAWYDVHRPAKKAVPPKVVTPGESSPPPKRKAVSGKEFALMSEEDQLDVLSKFLEE